MITAYLQSQADRDLTEQKIGYLESHIEQLEGELAIHRVKSLAYDRIVKEVNETLDDLIFEHASKFDDGGEHSIEIEADTADRFTFGCIGRNGFEFERSTKVTMKPKE